MNALLTNTPPQMQRRWLLGFGARVAAAAGLAAGLVPAPARAHAPFGLIEPLLTAPELALRWHDGRKQTLTAALHGNVTIVQTMFTGCSATCPIQGALFDDLQQLIEQLPTRDPIQAKLRLLSLSIDPLSDDPPALRQWLKRFNAGKRWAAASPTPEQVDQMLDFLAGREIGIDRHSTQLAIFDAQGRFAYRTASMPPPAAVLPVAQAIGRGEHLKESIANSR